jgi:hypothetical protein
MVDASNPGLAPKVPTADPNMGIIKSGTVVERRGKGVAHAKPLHAVLTNKALHLFKRRNDSDLFGEARGTVLLAQVTDVACTAAAPPDPDVADVGCGRGGGEGGGGGLGYGFAVTTDDFERHVYETTTAADVGLSSPVNFHPEFRD